MSDNCEKMALLLQSETDFGLGLLRQQNISESLVFSPLSIALALSLVHVAARGETRDQIREVLVKGATDEQLEQHFANISASLLAAEKGTQVNIANHVFSKSNFTIKQTYLDDVKKLYNAGATPLDFNNKEASAQAINDFVSKNTGEHIKKIISADAISDDLVAVLTNALYFKADWQNKFKPEATFKGEFFTTADSPREVDFLRASGANRAYAENDQFQVLSLPYKDDTFALTIFLPKTRFGLSDALNSIDSATIQHLLSNASNSLVNVRIPKWKIESELSLKQALEKLGIQKAFDDSADLGNLADGIFVSAVSHKALIEVDEDGTKAAAATTVSISLKSAPMFLEEPKDFIADHPFLFVLSKDNHPLFVGLHH
uniref:SERPIN domain-containing protein n=1 Tax=Caenorhabditis japonica TaxID=281687 RepID=A0A8R1I4D7_CAEJA